MQDEIETPELPIPEVEQPFFFDEFFSDEESGVEIKLKIKGRMVPLTIKRGLTLKEKIAAQGKAIKRAVDPKTGKITIMSIDEAEAAEEIAFLMLIKWPFVNRDGSPIPITRENVAKLVGVDKLVELSQKMDEEGDSALVPFVAPSVAA